MHRKTCGRLEQDEGQCKLLSRFKIYIDQPINLFPDQFPIRVSPSRSFMEELGLLEKKVKGEQGSASFAEM